MPTGERLLIGSKREGTSLYWSVCIVHARIAAKIIRVVFFHYQGNLRSTRRLKKQRSQAKRGIFSIGIAGIHYPRIYPVLQRCQNRVRLIDGTKKCTRLSRGKEL